MTTPLERSRPGQALNYDASFSGPPYSGALPSFDTCPGLITLGNSTFVPSGATAFTVVNSGGSFASTIASDNVGNWGSPNPVFGGATFDSTPVPEVAAFGAAAVGLLDLVYFARFARLRRNVKFA